METVRSFIAIELPEELKLGLSKLQAGLKTDDKPWIKWIDTNGIHLTLKFLGNIQVDRIGEITQAMTEAAQGFYPFHLEVRELGVFPDWKRVQVVWVGLGREVDKLGQLQQLIESKLACLGFAPESRPFRPHLTLARVRNHASPDERQGLGKLIASTKFETAYSMKVDAISLMRSQLTREGAIYSRISSVGLKKNF